MESAPDFEAVRVAARRIAGMAHRTPIETSETLDRLSGRTLFFKCEHMQKSGAFKFRGASNAIMKLTDAVAKRGVVTHSSGNHAGALALAARTRGITAHVVMPRNASPVKQRAAQEYGARIIECASTQSAREKTAATINPGLAYVGDSRQLAAEAIIPLNSEGGRTLGARAHLFLFLDDLFPAIFGKPLLEW